MATATELKTATEEKLTGQAGINPATGKPQDTELPTGTKIEPTLDLSPKNIASLITSFVLCGPSK